jgi:hypothetical protein
MKTTYEKFSKERAVLQSAPTTIPGKLHRWAVGLKVGLSIVPVHDKLTMKTQSLRLKAIKAAKFESALKRFSYDRKFFRSGLGSAGWVPSSAHVGDSVCVFEDCKVPFILRKCDGGYRLIGDCYAHGLMDRLNTDWDLDKVEMIHLV